MYRGKHIGNILSVFNRDREDEESYCDVILEVEGQQFPVHKCIVGKLSRFFHKMFKIEMKEKYTSSICLEKIKSENMKAVLDFMYTGLLNITNQNVVEILGVSDYLQMDEMKSFCVDFLVKSLDRSNCLCYHALGQTFHAQRLIDAALEVVCKNFEEVSKEKEFNDLKKKDLCDIMEIVVQKIPVIQSLYIATITWIKHDLDNRKQHLVDLFKLIKLHLLPTSFLEEVVANEHLVQDSKECLQYFVNELLHQRRTLDMKVPPSSSISSSSSSALKHKLRELSFGTSQSPSSILKAIIKRAEAKKETTSEYKDKKPSTSSQVNLCKRGVGEPNEKRRRFSEFREDSYNSRSSGRPHDIAAQHSYHRSSENNFDFSLQQSESRFVLPSDSNYVAPQTNRTKKRDRKERK